MPNGMDLSRWFLTPNQIEYGFSIERNADDSLNIMYDNDQVPTLVMTVPDTINPGAIQTIIEYYAEMVRRGKQARA